MGLSPIVFRPAKEVNDNIYQTISAKLISRSQPYFCFGRLAPYLERDCIRPCTP